MVLKEQTKVLKALIESRRTVHSYTEDQVPRELLLEALRASLWAPNHKMTRPWQFFILQSAQREALAASVIRIKNAKEPLSEVKQQALHTKFTRQGSLILCCRRKTLEEPEVQVNEDRATLACSIYIMSLFLWSEGFSSKWGSGATIRSDELFQKLNLSKECLEIVGLFYCGKPAHTLPAAPPRPDLKEVLDDANF